MPASKPSGYWPNTDAPPPRIVPDGVGEPASWNQAGHGDLRVIQLDPRRDAYVRQSHIAGVVALKEGGPSRILFSGGGHIDVCGSAEMLRLEIKIAELSERRT